MKPRVLLALLFLMPLLLASVPAAAQPQPNFVAMSVITSAASPGGDLTVALPVGYLANDLFILNCMIRSNTETVTVSGWTQATGSPFTRGTIARYWVWYRLATSATETAAAWDTDGSTADDFCVIAAYRNVNTATPIEVFGTATTGTADPALVTGLTTLTANALVVVPLIAEDNLDASIITTSTDPVNYIEHFAATATGADAEVSFSEEARIAAGATGTISVNFNVGGAPGWGSMALSLKAAGGAAGADGYNSLVKVTTAVEGAGANCANGGTKVTVESGLDNGDGGGTARNGVLEAGEVDATTIYYSCKGDQGIQGIQGNPGVNGFNSLIKITSEPPGGNCAYGGIRIDSGLDNGDGGGTPRNGILESGEIDATGYACNGTPGADGADGQDGTNGTDGNHAAVNVTAEPPGANCADGGSRIEGGVDSNGNGYLDAAEVLSTWFACDGPTGSDGSDGSQGPTGSAGTSADTTTLILWGLIAIALAVLVASFATHRRGA